ncbi:hypothetical protein [Roseovarius sp. SCSIO 43702]|uniref:hypothetical protein n=1 Tax=Roseovarius sp. SCSIO 43702 TaxID=2823043 RepID=UPI00217576FF|nr:hypothetical protein [Roseovarius sp. SCSIO 43702]
MTPAPTALTLAALLQVAQYVLMAVPAFLGWTAAINMPLMPGTLPRAEGLVWPVMALCAVTGFSICALSDSLRGTSLLPTAALSLGLLTGALALRLTVLPLLDTASPLALVGVREALAICSAAYLGFAIALLRRRRR